MDLLTKVFKVIVGPTSTQISQRNVLSEIVYRSQTTVENCIGGHVNVLLDYKKT